MGPYIQTYNRRLVRDGQCNIHLTNRKQNTEALRKSEHRGNFSRNANLSSTTTALIWRNSSACNRPNTPGNSPWTCHFLIANCKTFCYNRQLGQWNVLGNRDYINNSYYAVAASSRQILHVPNSMRSTSKLGAPFNTHSRLHGQFPVACKPMTQGLLYTRYLEKNSLYVTIESIRSIVLETQEFSSTEYDELLISTSVDITEIRPSLFGLTWNHHVRRSDICTIFVQRCKSRGVRFLAAAEDDLLAPTRANA